MHRSSELIFLAFYVIQTVPASPSASAEAPQAIHRAGTAYGARSAANFPTDVRISLCPARMVSYGSNGRVFEDEGVGLRRARLRPQLSRPGYRLHLFDVA